MSRIDSSADPRPKRYRILICSVADQQWVRLSSGDYETRNEAEFIAEQIRRHCPVFDVQVE